MSGFWLWLLFGAAVVLGLCYQVAKIINIASNLDEAPFQSARLFWAVIVLLAIVYFTITQPAQLAEMMAETLVEAFKVVISLLTSPFRS